MSELLRRWLRDDVGVAQHVDSFESAFASGFLFGEILARCNVQPDFAKFVNKNTPDARINNFTRLQPSLQKLGVPLDARAVTSIVREERGVASRLLVQLKSVLDAMVRDVEQSKRRGVSELARSASLPTRPTLSVAESHRGVGAFNSRLSTRRDADAKIFNDVVRAREARPNALMETARVRSFLAEGERQRAEAEEAARDRRVGVSNRTIDRRVESVNAFNATREAKAARAAAEYATHAEILRARASAERREIEIEMALEEKARVSRLARDEREGEEALRGLDAFEKNLSRRGQDGASLESPARLGARKSLAVSNETLAGEGRISSRGSADPREHIAAMRASLPDPRALRQEGERTLRRIKSDRSEEALARAERERRRRKLDAHRERADAAAEARRREDELLATLAFKSKQETRVAERLREIERERDVMRDNRRDRDARYEAQRRADWEAALRREAKLAAQRRAAYRADAAAAAADIDDALSASERERREDVLRFVEGALGDIVALACRCAEYRETTEKLVPRREYREWTGLLVAGEPLPFALPSRESEVVEKAEAVTGGARVVTRLDEANARDYLRGEGDWARAALGSRLTPHDGGLGREGVRADDDAADPTENADADDARTNDDDKVNDSDGARTTNDDEVKDEGTTKDDDGSSSADDALANRMLGSAVFDVTVAALPDSTPTPDSLPDAGCDARLAIVGPPFCGKSTAARKLAQSKALVLIDPNELTREAATEAAAWRDAERAAAEAAAAAAAEKAAEEAAAEKAAEEAKAAGEGEDDAAEDTPEAEDTPVAEAEGAGRTEGVTDEAAEETPEAKKPEPSKKVVLGLRALDATEAGAPVPPSVVAGLIALAVDALAPPKPPPVVYPPPVTDADLEGDDEDGADADALPELPEEPAEDAPDEAKVAYAAAVAEREARADARAAARAALRSEKETARLAEIDALDAAYEAAAAELEATYPRPPGYVIDGFPCTAAEAAALERALTGLDETRAESLRASVSVVAPPAEHEILARVDVSYVSGLDGIITLELPCEPDCQAATLRALGRRVDPETGVAYHLDFDPPPEDEPGLAERLRLCEPPEATRVEQRLHAWNADDELAKLGDWLAKFETSEASASHTNADEETRGAEKKARRSGLRVPIDARVSAGEVFQAVEAEATRVLDSKRSARAVAAAADTAAVAAANCQKAAETVKESGLALEKAAKQLLDLRKAEIEAKALVEEAGGDAAAGDDAGDVPEPAKPAKATAAASALLAEKASEAVAAELVRARQAAAEAATHAADAEAAWEAAKRAVADAERARGDAEATASARAASESALERAVAAGDAASASLRAAQEASASIDATVARADAAVAATDADDVAAAEALGEDAAGKDEDATEAPAEEGSGEGTGEGTAEGSRSSKTDEETSKEEDTRETRATGVARDAALVPIPAPLAEAIRERWTATERAYVEGVRVALRDAREARARAVARFAETKTEFSAFLRRPDEKMSLVRAFQKEFNEIDLDHRRDPRTVGELLVRADELRDALWDVCDERLAENVAERGAIAADTWAADHAEAVVAHYCALVQLELDKFAETAPVLADYFAGRRGEPLPEDDAAPSGEGGEGGGEAEADAPAAVEDSKTVVSWFEAPPPVPDVIGHDAFGAGDDGSAEPPGTEREAVPPPPVPSPDDEDLPEWIRALARAPEAPEDSAAAESSGGAGGAPDDFLNSDPNPVPGPTAPALAGAMAAALAYVRAYAPDAPPDAAPGEEAEAEETGANPPDAETGEEAAFFAAPLRAPAETAAAMREERRVLETRLERIADRCATHVAELSDVARLCHARLAASVKAKYKAECGAVAALAEEVKVAAETARPLEKDLTLESTENLGDVLVVAEEETAIPPPPSPPAPPPAEPAPLDPGTFSGTQFFNLCAALADAAPSGVITPAECASVMERLAACDSGAPQLQTMQTEFSNSLPPAYATAGRRRLANVARLFKFGDSPYVEWRALVASTLAAMYPAVLDASPETIAASAAQLRAPAKAGKRVFARARKLWFLPSGTLGPEDDQEDAFAAGQRTWGAASLAARAGNGAGAALARRAASGDVAAAAVMAGLAEAFGAPGSDGEVDITTLALHLCVSATPELGAGKAVEVARWLIDPEAEREAKRVAEAAEKEAAAAERRAKDVAEGRAAEGDAVAAGTEQEGFTEVPPMDYKEKRAAWCAAAGPGAMSAAAVELLKKKDLEGKDVDLPAMAVASGAGGAAPLLGIATRKWFNRYGFKDCHAVVMM